MLILHKIDFKIKKITKDKNGHFIVVKEIVHQEDITLINIHAPDLGAPKCMKQFLADLKEKLRNIQL